MMKQSLALHKGIAYHEWPANSGPAPLAKRIGRRVGPKNKSREACDHNCALDGTRW